MNMDLSKFLLEMMKNLNSSLDLTLVLTNTYTFLKEYFPLAGISLHKFLPEQVAVQTLFFVNDEGCHYNNKITVINEQEYQAMLKVDEVNQVEMVCLADCIMKNFISKQLLPFINNDNPSILATPLVIKSKDIVGHILFFSKKNFVFTQEHLELFTLIKDTFISTMINIHHYKAIKNSNDQLKKENALLSATIEDLSERKIISTSDKMKKVSQTIETLAHTELPVLILGETGTGKELIADKIQKESMRANNIFIKVNCGALPDSLIDSELFGYEKGAFTGAYETKKGYFEQANNGTLFLDEVGELSLQAQVRLLRVLQFGVIERVGSRRSIPVNVRIIAATNRNLEYMLQQGTFREDLYYRLQAFPIYVPPLRERREDIYPIIQYIMAKVSKKFDIPLYPIKKECLEKLYQYSWPGNIRELENLVERTMILNKDTELCFTEYLPKDPLWYQIENTEDYKKNLKKIVLECLEELGYSSKIDKKENIVLKNNNDFMKEQIIEALKQSKGKVSGKNSASELLNINCNTLRKRMERLDISVKKIWE